VFAKDLPKIDLIIGGSPCQGFSFAGKGLNFEDERSKLFFEFVRLVKECKPKHFLLENVKMKKEYEMIISTYLGVSPVQLNSALVSAQNRVRNYWTNITQVPPGMFRYIHFPIPQPKDKGILLRDILESEVDEKYYLSKRMLSYFLNRAANFNKGKINIREEQEKASCLTSSMASYDISDNFIKADTNLTPSNNQKKANCLTAGGNSGGLHSDMTLIAAMRGRNPENPKSRKKGIETEQQLEPRFDNKTNCLTSVQKDNLVLVDFSYKNEAIRHYKHKLPTLQQRDYKDPKCFSNGIKIRRLTPTECERLQTVPDGYTAHVSDTQRYRMIGNGFTVDAIAHILSFGKLPKHHSAR